MASLQDLLALHEIRVNNELQKTAPTEQALNYLSATVAKKIEDDRAEKKAKIVQQENNEKVLKAAKKATSAGKLAKISYKSGGDIEASVEEPDTSTSIDYMKELRLQKEQELRDARYDIETMYKRGGQIDMPRVQELGKQLNMDLLPELQAGRGEATIGPNGEKRFRVLSDPEWQAKISQGKFTATEIEDFNNIVDENRKWKDVISELDALGINEDAIQNVEFIDVMGDMGPISIPATINLVGQYAKDPKYTAIKRKVEQAFLAYKKRITGAQSSVQEHNLLRSTMPILRDNPKVFFSTIKSLLKDNEDAFNSRLNLYETFGRDTSEIRKNYSIHSPVVTEKSDDDSVAEEEYQRYLKVVGG